MVRATLLLISCGVCILLGSLFDEDLRQSPIVATYIKTDSLDIFRWNSEYPVMNGVLVHETVHYWKKNGVLDRDIPTASALGYYVSFANEESIPTSILRLLTIALTDGEKLIDSDSLNAIHRRVDQILSAYVFDNNESLSSYPDGGILAGLALALFSGDLELGRRYITALSAGCDSELAYRAGRDSLLYQAIWDSRNGNEISLREVLLSDYFGLDSGRGDFVRDYLARSRRDGFQLDSVTVESALNFAAGKQEYDDLNRIDSLGSRTIVIADSLGEGLKTWDRGLPRAYWINTSPPPGSSTPIDPLFIAECVRRIADMELNMIGRVRENYAFSLNIKPRPRNTLDRGLITIEWTYGIEYPAVTTVQFEGYVVTGALIRFHPSMKQFGYISQEIMHTTGSTGHVTGSRWAGLTIMVNPLPKVERVWSDHALAMSLAEKYMFLANSLIEVGAMEVAREQLVEAEKASNNSYQDLVSLAQLWIRANDPQKALAFGIKAQAISPDDEALKKLLVYLYNETHQYALGDSVLNQIDNMTLDKDVSFALSLVAQRIINGDAKRALVDAQELLRANPGRADILLTIASAYEKLNEKIEAEKHIEAALRLDSTSSMSTYRAGLLYLQIQETKKAEKWLNVALQLEPRLRERIERLGIIANPDSIRN